MPFIGNRTIFANFNLKGLQDPESYYYNYNEDQFNVLNNVSESLNLKIDKTHAPFSNGKKADRLKTSVWKKLLEELFAEKLHGSA